MLVLISYSNHGKERKLRSEESTYRVVCVKRYIRKKNCNSIMYNFKKMLIHRKGPIKYKEIYTRCEVNIQNT